MNITCIRFTGAGKASLASITTYDQKRYLFTNLLQFWTWEMSQNDKDQQRTTFDPETHHRHFRKHHAGTCRGEDVTQRRWKSFCFAKADQFGRKDISHRVLLKVHQSIARAMEIKRWGLGVPYWQKPSLQEKSRISRKVGKPSNYHVILTKTSSYPRSLLTQIHYA